jgi:prolyl oligopeptidase
MPFLLYGYGGFNISLLPRFRARVLPWLEAGGGYAVPNLRGGGEYGEAWHQAGMGARKQNVFDDFIAAAEHLIAEGYTRSERLAIMGGSNGGLLVGAAMTQRPELYKAVVCAVPLLDMVRYHLFGSGRTWISEYGSSEDPAQFQTLHAYSPYHRVVDGTEYPALLMLAADHDDRVDPLHARKFVARLRDAHRGEAPILMRIERNSGHGGSDRVSKAVEQSTDTTAFLMRILGVRPVEAN